MGRTIVLTTPPTELLTTSLGIVVEQSDPTAIYTTVSGPGNVPMGKEADLIEAAKENDYTRILVRFHVLLVFYIYVTSFLFHHFWF